MGADRAEQPSTPPVAGAASCDRQKACRRPPRCGIVPRTSLDSSRRLPVFRAADGQVVARPSGPPWKGGEQAPPGLPGGCVHARLARDDLPGAVCAQPGRTHPRPGGAPEHRPRAADSTARITAAGLGSCHTRHTDRRTGLPGPPAFGGRSDYRAGPASERTTY
jgi:hypothetical protein